MGNKVKPAKREINKFEMPSMNNIYSSNYVKKAEEIERHAAKKAYKEAMNPKKNNRVMTLAGQLVDSNTFTHNNMEPYFGGTIRQNTDVDRNRVLLEKFTGVQDIPTSKCEVKSFFDQSKDLGNVYGMENNDEFYKSRIEQPRIRNNEVPIAQIKVGPGLNKGYSSEPTGGFQQLDAREFEMDKCVDQLRVKNKPKLSYEARNVDGIKGNLPAEMGEFNKNRVERFYQQTEDMLLKTTGANLKPSEIPVFNVKPTNRLNTSKEYMGAAGGMNKRTLDSDVKETTRQQLTEAGIRNAVLSALGLGNKTDYGKSNIVVYSNERDLTTTKTYQGNITSLIKSIVAPIVDIIKTTKKQEGVDNPRHFGNFNAQMPEKPTMYDPTDVAKTTIKETTVSEIIAGNLKGNAKLTIYDADDVPRITTKETLIHEAVMGNLKGSERITIHDPDDVLRTTTKETLIHDADLGNLKGGEKITIYDDAPARTTLKETTVESTTVSNLKGKDKLTIYDPTDVLRTTIKETLLHDEIGTGTITGAKELYVYDPEEIAKKTIRETLDNIDSVINMASGVKKPELQKDDEAKRTMKETLIDMIYTGQADAKERGGAYEVTDYVAKAVQRQFLADKDRIGGAQRNMGEGYVTNPMTAKEVQRSQLADIEYFGGADAEQKRPMSYDDYENAHVDERKEVLLFEREPTNTGAKEFNANISMMIKKPDCVASSSREANNVGKIYSHMPELSDRQITKNRLSVDLDSRMGFDRIDPDLLKVFRENIYTKPLDSVM